MLDTLIDRPRSHAATIERFFAAIKDGDWATLQEVLTPEAVTRWPQSGEQVTGAMSCIRIYQSYPGGPPTFRIASVVGDGDVAVAELVLHYGTERWYLASVVEFDGERITRMTDYFAPTLPAPEWRKGLVAQLVGNYSS